MDPKPFASLSASLLARKGAARPAMRRPHMGSAVSPSLPASVQDDLGWNDMGEESPSHSAPPLTMIGVHVVEPAPGFASSAPPPPTVVQQQEELAERLVRPVRAKTKKSLPSVLSASPQATAATKASQSPTKKAAFTLRLDPDRHLRLRLACAVGNRSAQQIVIEALDAVLNSQPQLEELARQIPQSGPASK
jgi:hypothetical protein